MSHTGTIWRFICPCRREHEFKRPLVSVDSLNDERARAEKAEVAAKALARALKEIADDIVVPDSVTLSEWAQTALDAHPGWLDEA